jgi:hypothetical protein
MRGLGPFKILKEDMGKGQKVAIDQVCRHLMGDLIVQVKGAVSLYEVTTDTRRLKPTLVRPMLPNKFKFRVTSPYVTYPSAEAVPCAEAVSLINGRRACTLVMPDVSTSFQYLLNELQFPNRIQRLESLGVDAESGGRSFVADYRKVVDAALYRAGYMGLLVPDHSDTSLTFVVVSEYSSAFPRFLQTMTRPWFKEYSFDEIVFHAEVSDNFGNHATLDGEPTYQVLRSQSGVTKKQELRPL